MTQGTVAGPQPAKIHRIAGSPGTGSPFPLKPRLSPLKNSVRQGPGKKAVSGRPSQSAILTRWLKRKPRRTRENQFSVENHNLLVESTPGSDMFTGMDPQYWSDLVKQLGDDCKSITNIIGLGCLIGKGIMSVFKKESGDMNEEKNPMYVLS